jgi:hypothetical protein
MSNTHWKKLVDTNFLGSYSFDDVVGAGTVATISKISREETYNPQTSKKEMCTVATFRENIKPMILNKTNCKTIQVLSGTPFVEKWVGLAIKIVVEKVKVKGELILALRIAKEKVTAGQTPARTSPPPTQTAQIHCEDCNDYITGFGEHTAQALAEYTEKKYGKKLCAECASRVKERIEAGNETDA